MKNDFLVSIVVPVYNEEENIAPFLKRLIPILKDFNYEVIFVDDGSSDQTGKKIEEYIKKNKNIRLVSFTRNFGHQAALSAGYQLAKGDCVVSLDVDLQDPPEIIPLMIRKWQQGAKIVYGKREERQDPLFKKITASLFYHLINFLSDTPIPKQVGDFRLLDKEVVDFLNQLPERSRFLRGLVAWGGFSSEWIPFKRGKRTIGETHYPLKKMINFALEGIISFSTKPLKIASYLGFLTAFLGGVGIVYALFRRLFLPHKYWVTGWTALFVAIMFFGGIQLIAIGIIGEYLAKIYREIQGRPMFLIKKKVNF